MSLGAVRGEWLYLPSTAPWAGLSQSSNSRERLRQTRPYRARFVTEARLLAALDHPHVVPVFDFVEKDGLCLLVMELLPGGTVWSRFGGNGFTPPAACATVLAASAGLQAAHEKNVLHRDVKPENLMFSSEGVLKVTDFGIAKVVGGDSTLATRAGEVLGTPAYIAPEQARGARFLPPPTSTPWPPCCTSFSPGRFLFRRMPTPWRCCSSTPTRTRRHSIRRRQTYRRLSSRWS